METPDLKPSVPGYVERAASWVKGAGMFSLGILTGTVYGSFISARVAYYVLKINN